MLLSTGFRKALESTLWTRQQVGLERRGGIVL